MAQKIISPELIIDDCKITGYFAEYSNNELSIASEADPNVRYHFNIYFPEDDAYAKAIISKNLVPSKENKRLYNTELYLDKPGFQCISIPGRAAMFVDRVPILAKNHILLNVMKYTQKNIPELKDWADNCIDIYNQAEKTIIHSGFADEQHLVTKGGQAFQLDLITDKPIHCFEDIDMFASSTKYIQSADTLIEFAVQVLDKDAEYQMAKNNNEKELPIFKEAAAKIIAKPESWRTDEDKELLEAFDSRFTFVYDRKPGLSDIISNKSDTEKSANDEREE